MSFSGMYGLNRTLCSVLEDMRSCDKVKNYSSLLSLVEEVQVLGNRMEAKLYDLKDIDSLHDDIKKLKAEVKLLEQKKEDLEFLSEALKPKS